MVKTLQMSTAVPLEAKMIAINGKWYSALFRARFIVVTLSQNQNRIVILLAGQIEGQAHKTNYQICVSLQLRINPYQNKKERHYLHQYSSAYRYVLPGYAIDTFNSKKKILTNFKTDVPLKRKYVNVKYVNTFIHVLLWDNINLHNL